MNWLNKTIFIFITAIFCFQAKASETVVFYNAENLFDYFDDSLKQDNEYLPESLRKWTPRRFSEKITNTYKAIASVSDQIPMLIGLCEVENENIHYNLLKHTPLKFQNYKFIHHESRDIRGIDVALLYQTTKLKLLNSETIPTIYNNDTLITRDILYVQFENLYKDTLHVFVNHWPSRRGGKEKSSPKRMAAAEALHRKLEMLKSSNVIIMGDFNDEPKDASIQLITSQNFKSALTPKKNTGTLKYQALWQNFDLFILSHRLDSISKAENIGTQKIGDAPFLFQQDKRFSGQKPYRTYLGLKYQPGYSDHLPISIQIPSNL